MGAVEQVVPKPRNLMDAKVETISHGEEKCTRIQTIYHLQRCRSKK
jgi:hypothetical protein